MKTLAVMSLIAFLALAITPISAQACKGGDKSGASASKQQAGHHHKHHKKAAGAQTA